MRLAAVAVAHSHLVTVNSSQTSKVGSLNLIGRFA